MFHNQYIFGHIKAFVSISVISHYISYFDNLIFLRLCLNMTLVFSLLFFESLCDNLAAYCLSLECFFFA